MIFFLLYFVVSKYNLTKHINIPNKHKSKVAKHFAIFTSVIQNVKNLFHKVYAKRMFNEIQEICLHNIIMHHCVIKTLPGLRSILQFIYILQSEYTNEMADLENEFIFYENGCIQTTFDISKDAENTYCEDNCLLVRKKCAIFVF